MREQTRESIRRIESAVRAGDYATALTDARRLYWDATSEAERAELLVTLGPRAVPPAASERG
ncbi:hypothetical protein [Streptomyces noursei]|uniref:hypothetical protein n=1 Tax=Streptomyces noursei TaxID=1971 RepID=UPI003825A15C